MFCFKKIIPFFLVLTTVFSCSFFFSVSASADGISDFVDLFSAISDAFEDEAEQQGLTNIFSVWGMNRIDEYSCSGCTSSDSPNGCHHWHFQQYGNLLFPGIGTAYCDYCSITLKEYYESAYADYVDTLPLNGYGSDGGFLWYPTLSDYPAGTYFLGYDTLNWLRLPLSFPCVNNYANRDRYSVTQVDSRSFFVSAIYEDLYKLGSPTNLSATAPISGTYYRLSTVRFSNPVKYYSSANLGSISAGSPVVVSSSCFLNAHVSTTYFYLPVYKVVPAESVSSSTYSEDTRLGGITFDLGVESTGSGDVTVYNDITVIDEQNNTFTDPSTGTTYPIDSWQYDYGSRKYNLVIPTVDGTLNATVEFGVDSLNINFGGQTIEYSYMVETHSHEYVGAITTQPTCTQPGTKTFSCTICNDSYTEPVQALGHDYQLSEVEPFYYELDSSSVLCPECDSDDVTCSQSGDTSTFNCSCNDCSHAWTVTGSAVAGRNKFVCSRCGDITYDDVGTDEDMSDIPFWKWLQQWLIRFKEWLGEKLDGISSGNDIDLDTGNTYDIDSYDTDITYQYIDEDGENQEFEVKDLFKKFAFVKDIYSIGKTLMIQVTADADFADDYEDNFSFLGSDQEAGISDLQIDGSFDDPQIDGSSIMSGGVPSITINLGSANSVYGVNYGGSVAFLDLSWYTPYKSTVDNIISGFLWVAFCWMLFKKAPGIISGSSLDSEKLADIDADKKYSQKRR